MPDTESQIEAKLTSLAKKMGVYTRKFSSPSRRGVPDRIYIHKGNVVFIELKAPGCRPKPLQVREIIDIEKQGGIAFWADSYEAVANFLRIMVESDLPDTVSKVWRHCIDDSYKLSSFNTYAILDMMTNEEPVNADEIHTKRSPNTDTEPSVN